ncbi:hypothetical protein GCM10009114_37330 [Aliiglaciecola litoralis]|uniref:Uncharacterized protein n=2 Tax=Aliiglaciecola litoralis TaxID=582857 RepID=A0ABP3X4F6_9ALTE
MLVGFMFIGMLTSLGDEPISEAIVIVLGLGSFGLVLGLIGWFMGGRVSSK